MVLKAFTIRDAKGEVFHPPFFKRHHGEAERDFTALVRDPKSQMHQFPEDYDLYFVGEYDDQTGVFKSLETPQHMMKAVNVSMQ